MEFLKENYEVKDNLGNSLVVTKTGVAYLKLKSEASPRTIGKIIKQGDIIAYYKKVIESKHLFRKNNSFGVNYELLSKLPEDSKLIIDSDIKTYTISKKKAIEKGQFLFFKEQGFEKQFFIQKDFFE